jgi:hypothetical protein
MVLDFISETGDLQYHTHVLLFLYAFDENICHSEERLTLMTFDLLRNWTYATSLWICEEGEEEAG